MFQCPSLGCATRGSCNPVGSICHERYDPADLTTCGVDDGNVGGWGRQVCSISCCRGRCGVLVPVVALVVVIAVVVAFVVVAVVVVVVASRGCICGSSAAFIVVVAQ